MNKLKPTKLWIIYGIVFAAYLCIAIFAGIHHEPWADEAQSWLIARDNHSLIGIFRAVKLEGTLPTWHLINKAFQLAGLDYDHIFVIPLLFSAIGVLLLFFTDAPLTVKVTLPFTFFAVYQNAVVARQYALVFPAMMLIVILYKKRFEVPVRYHLALFFLALTSSYGVIVTCSFMLWDFICMVRKKFKDPVFNKTYMPFFTTGIVILVMSYLSLPPDDCSMVLDNIQFAKNVTNTLLYTIDDDLLRWIFLIFVAGVFIYYFRHCLIRALVIFSPLVIFMNVLYHRPWHMTYLFFLLVSMMIIFRDDFKKTPKHIEDVANFLVKGIVGILLAVHVFSGFYSIYFDYKYAYSGAKETAEFLKPYVESGATLNRVGFYSMAVSPYYDHSIFANDTCGVTYFVWSYNVPNGDLSEEWPDVLVSYRYYDRFDNADYEVHRFDSNMTFKMDTVEAVPYIVYVKKGI